MKAKGLVINKRYCTPHLILKNYILCFVIESFKLVLNVTETVNVSLAADI